MKRIQKAFRKYTQSIFGKIILTAVTVVITVLIVEVCLNLFDRIFQWEWLSPDGKGKSFFVYAEAAVGVLAALLVVRQLRKETEAEAEETLLHQSTFIKDYNLTFISTEYGELTKVEYNLEKYYDDHLKGEARSLEVGDLGSKIRQKYINYLAYLESLALVIHNKSLKIETMESLMGYRFFIAVNNPVLQKEELIPFSLHYRGIFLLYEKWVVDKYRHLREISLKVQKELKKLNDHQMKQEKKPGQESKTIERVIKILGEAAEPGKLKKGALKDLHGSLKDLTGILKKLSDIESDQKWAKRFGTARAEAAYLAMLTGDENGASNGLLGMPMFQKETFLCREEYKDVYEATICKPSLVPHILEAFDHSEN